MGAEYLGKYGMFTVFASAWTDITYIIIET